MPTIRELGFAPGRLQPGARNALTDVAGVRVGHCTVHSARHNTGVTVILPREDVYFHKCTAAAAVINGYGKSAGLVPIEELGQLENPDRTDQHPRRRAGIRRARPAHGRGL